MMNKYNTNFRWPPSNHPDISKLGEIYPPKNMIFRAFELCPFEEVKVVIIGQDPYPTKSHANGLAFSVNKGISIPSSLRNIFSEIKRDYPHWNTPIHGELDKWAKEGVLLLNASLSVEVDTNGKGVKNSHQKYWKTFTEDVIRLINERKKDVVFLLWGNFAQSFSQFINHDKHNILIATHPSFYSYNKSRKNAPSFCRCGHFKKTNELLKERGIKEIKW